MMWVNIENDAAWDALDQLSARREPFTPRDDPSEVVAWVQSVYVATSRDSELHEAIHLTLRRSGSTKRHWLGVDGAANSGKSEMLIRFALAYRKQSSRPDTDATGYRHVPVIYVQADSGQQGAGLLRTIADAAGIPRQGNEDEVRRRLIHVLPLLGTVLVIVDDAHMLRRSSHRATKLTDSLRATLRIPVAFVFAGAGLHSSALLRVGGPVGYESTEQLYSRHTMLSLRPLTLSADRDFLRRLIGDYLKTLACTLPHLDTPFRSDNAVLAKLVDATGGRVGSLMGLLKDGTVEALHRGTPLTSDLLLQLGSRHTGTTL